MEEGEHTSISEIRLIMALFEQRKQLCQCLIGLLHVANDTSNVYYPIVKKYISKWYQEKQWYDNICKSCNQLATTMKKDDESEYSAIYWEHIAFEQLFCPNNNKMTLIISIIIIIIITLQECTEFSSSFALCSEEEEGR
ncbi:hypothetical protein RFI_04896 [Reticulomyxa filosa]|uniref:Uncharacterized protein n=1 Tax=Reticulomyxa filosa TaxID=46433 RepID=X6P2C0_RETFI|nr:hypothetical protein RFI_04896 [Reticulomyxa filosa]|eukprot:ETO32219.1 hypothetical protein RFI_04896 [Reticulomyxa filosa]